MVEQAGVLFRSVLHPRRWDTGIDGESVPGRVNTFTGVSLSSIYLGAHSLILVTSANDHIGKEVVNVLRSKGMKVRAFVRNAEPGQEDESGVLEYFKGDFFDRKSLSRAFAGIDRVMHISPPRIPASLRLGRP